RDGERIGILECDETGITAEHEHRAMREVEHAERAIDDGQAGADQRQQRSERQAIEHLRNEVRPVNHENKSQYPPVRPKLTSLSAIPTKTAPRENTTRDAKAKVSLRYSRRAYSRTHPASASDLRRARFRRCRNSLPCPSCPCPSCPSR